MLPPPTLPFEIDDIKFHSNDHIRYQNGQVAVTSASDSKGHNFGANRGLQIEPNINGGEGYTVTMFNMDGDHPVWGNNVQMAPKQMKIDRLETGKIVLRGFGHDQMGGAFSDYGLTIVHDGSQPTKLILHMHDRNVDIEYFKSDVEVKKEPEIIKYAKQAAIEYQNNNLHTARNYLVQIYRMVKANPEQLGEVSEFEPLGKAFLLMLDQELSDDIDTLQMMVSVGYLCISKAIENDKENINLYKDRLILLRLGHDPLKYTIMYALDISAVGFMAMHSDLQARDAIYKMEIADLELNPILYRQVDFFSDRMREFNTMINDEFFLPQKSKEEIVRAGLENHNKLFKYLENRIIEDGDVDF